MCKYAPEVGEGYSLNYFLRQQKTNGKKMGSAVFGLIIFFWKRREEMKEIVPKPDDIKASNLVVPSDKMWIKFLLIRGETVAAQSFGSGGSMV